MSQFSSVLKLLSDCPAKFNPITFNQPITTTTTDPTVDLRVGKSLSIFKCIKKKSAYLHTLCITVSAKCITKSELGSKEPWSGMICIFHVMYARK